MMFKINIILYKNRLDYNGSYKNS